MKPNDSPRSRVKASPVATPIANCSVGARNWTKPIVDRGSRRADQANRASGSTVARPLNRPQAKPDGEAKPCPCPAIWSHST